MFDNYGIEIAQIFKKAEKIRKDLKHPYVGSEHLLLAILSEDNEVSRTLKTYGLNYTNFEKELVSIVGKSNKDTDFVLYTPLLRRIIENATVDAKENNGGKVNERHLFLAMLEEGEGIAIRIMIGLDIDIDSIYDELKFSLIGNYNEKLTIYQIGNNLNKNVSQKEKTIGREEEISSVIEALLRKKKSNPLLIGKAGVGKTAIVEELARRINKGLVPNELLNKTIVMLEMGSLVSGTKYRGEFEERLTKIIKEVIDNKNIILFIDEIHTMINAGGAEGAINASDILKPYLARGDIKCIGATTTEEYYKTIYKDKALDRRFYAIQVEEPDKEKTEEILKGIKKEYEEHHHITISDENIKDLVKYADIYLKTKSNPDKTIDLLDMICASVKVKNASFIELERLNTSLEKIKKNKEEAFLKKDYDLATKYKEEENLLLKEINQITKKKKTSITKKDILEVIEKKTNIPILKDKKEIFLQIKNNLEKQIIGQPDAIKQILKNIWLKLTDDSKVLSILLNGPSGVGKTESIKQIAKGIKTNFIRLDMSEYNLDTSVNRLIGVSAGYVGYDDAYIFRSILDNPYSIILVDEIEKAHPRVLNLFLQILDEGFVTTAQGEKIDFTHTMIFMTSNIVDTNNVGFIKGNSSSLNETFAKEFLGRFSDIITFNSLSDNVLKDYIKKNLTNKKIDFDKLKKEAECEKYGLRNLKKLILKYNNEIELEIPL